MKEAFVERYQVVANKVDALSIRERVLVCVTLIAMVYSVWDTFFFTMVFGSNEEVVKSATQLRGQIENLRTQIGSLSEVISSDPYHELKEKAETIKRENKHFEQQIKIMAEQLIPPDKMSQLLSNILTEDSDVTLVRLENLPEEALFKPTPQQGENGQVSAGPSFQVYKHGLTMEFTGTFFNIQSFVEKLEKLPWKIIWGGLDYQVDTHPTAKVLLTLYTLSLNERWIGA